MAERIGRYGYRRIAALLRPNGWHVIEKRVYCIWRRALRIFSHGSPLEELGDHWGDCLIHLPLRVEYNGAPFGRANAGADATLNMAQLIAHAAKTRPLVAGTIIGSGTISNKGADGGPGKPVSKGGLGYSCIAEIRMIEKIATGEFVTPFASPGDEVRIEMLDEDGKSIFGAINQTVVSN